MKYLSSVLLIAAILVANVFAASANTKQEIEKANKKGQIVFLVVTEKLNAQNQVARSIANKAQKLVKNSAVVELNRSSSENSELIQKYRLSGAPIPLLVVISSDGFVCGGAPADGLTADEFVKMVPTPRETDLVKALNQGKSVFVVFSKSSDSKNVKQLDACESAEKGLDGKAVTVNVYMNDKKEKPFIDKFSVDPKADFPMTFVLNAKGQVTGSFNGITESKDLVAAAKKVASGGGCGTSGGGCGTSCAPPKK